MKEKCAKCGGKIFRGNLMIEGGEYYLFCGDCARILENNPHESVISFMGSKKEGWVARNMRLARKRREEGKSPWANVSG